MFKRQCRQKRKTDNHTPATTNNDTHCDRIGRTGLETIRIKTAIIPAISARATVTKTGSKSMTANRVAGNDPLKITTPIRPLNQPARVRETDCAITCVTRSSI